MSTSGLGAHRCLLPTLAVASLLGISHASAQIARLDQKVQGSGICDAALFAQGLHLRKRPLAIQNEGDAPAFVTCAMPQFSDPRLSQILYGVEVYFINNDDSDITIRCTGVSSGPYNIGLVYVPKTVEVHPGDTPIMFLFWGAWSEDGSGKYTTISCALPPGGGISYLTAHGGHVETPYDQ